MSSGRILLGVPLMVALLTAQVFAGPFVLFPKAGQLRSPDGRFAVRIAEREASLGEFAGTFRSLWITDSSTGRSHKLCEYVGLAAVAWSTNNLLVVTQYLSHRTSRAVVFSADESQEPIVLDVPTLIRMVPADLRPMLRGNDHVFVEASGLEDDTLFLRVWGHGRNDTGGFRWRCKYSLSVGAVSCERGNSK